MRGKRLNLCHAGHESIAFTADICPFCAARSEVREATAEGLRIAVKMLRQAVDQYRSDGWIQVADEVSRQADQIEDFGHSAYPGTGTGTKGGSA